MNNFRKLIAGALLLALCLCLFAACAPAAEFTFATDLEDGRVQAEAAYSFRLSILHGDEPVTPEVTCNGILLTAAENHTYTAPLRDGENEIEFSAQQGKDRIARTYRVTRRAEFTFPALSEDWRIEDDRISVPRSTGSPAPSRCFTTAVCSPPRTAFTRRNFPQATIR